MPQKMASVWDDLTVADVVSNVFVEVATLAWVFFLGAAVGSFVNVILYRMPLRINLLWPPSRCPMCLNRLKFVDNLPVVGFLRLRGKCRHCGAVIPRSYLHIEIGFGLLFLALTYLEIHSGGMNLPIRGANNYPGALWNLWYPRPDLVRIWVYHLALAGVLGTLYLFARRGAWFPGLFVGGSLLAGVLPNVWLAGLHQVPWTPSYISHPSSWQLTGVTESLLGFSSGVTVGAVLALLWPVWATEIPTERARWAVPPHWNAAVVLAFVGAWLGWQAAISVAVLTATLTLVLPRPSATTLAVVATAIQLAGWGLLTRFAPWWPGPHTGWLLALGWAIVVAALAYLARYRGQPEATAEGPQSESLPPPETPHIAPAVPEAGSAADS